MSGNIVNRSRPGKFIDIILDKVYNKSMPKPINLRPGYDIEYIKSYCHIYSIEQFEKGGRQDLVDKEQFEIAVLQGYMPAAMPAAELDAAVSEAIASSGAKVMADMGKVMAVLKPKLAGRADMGKVSALVKTKLTG